jgi:methyltransferase (TIGR00027 family)
MVLAAVEQNESPGHRLVDDDLAVRFLPAPLRALVWATRSRMLRNGLIAANERVGAGSWAPMACRKHFIDDKLAASIEVVDAVVILGAGLDTRGYRLARRSDIPVFEVDQDINIARKAATVRRVLGAQPPSAHLVAVDFERDDLITVLAEHGYRRDARTFFIWEGVTQYLTPDAVRATLDQLRQAAPGSRLAVTYVCQDFIDGRNMYGTPWLHRRFVEPLSGTASPIWKSGLDPAGVGELRPAGRTLAVSGLERTVYAEKI